LVVELLQRYDNCLSAHRRRVYDVDRNVEATDR